MRQFSLYAVCLVLFLCGTVSAQQALVEYTEKDDPCAVFKMRILVPGNHVDFKRWDQKRNDGIDNKMVWNPCPQPEAQLAFALVEPSPRSFGFQFPTRKGGNKQAEFPFPHHLSPFSKYLQQ